MKKILVLQRSLTHYRKLLLQHIAGRGVYDIDIGCIGEKENQESHIVVFSSRNLMKYKNYQIEYSGEMINFVKHNFQKYDYIVLEGAPNLVNNLPICRFLLAHKKPYIIWDAGRRKNAEMTVWRKLAQKPLLYVWKNAAAIIAYSTLAKAYFTDIGIPEERIFVCQNTICVSEFDRQIEQVSPHELQALRMRYAPDGQNIILYVGAIQSRKRIKDLIDIYLQKLDRTNNVLLIIGGGEQLDELREYVSGRDGIHLLGPIVDGVMPYFLISDVFALPSEGGLSLNQAMICKKPVVASSADGTELDLIEDGRNGFLFEESNLDDFAEKIKLVLEDETVKCAMGIHSRMIIDNKVNEEEFVKNFQRCLDFVEL